MKPVYPLFLAACCTLLAACGSGDVKETLGLTHQAPDEFRVLARPPLSVPPDFNIRPPGQESEYVGRQPAQAKAHEKVLEIANMAAAASGAGNIPGKADAMLLANAGVAKVDPQIRQRLLDERGSGAAVQDSRYLFGGKAADEPQVEAKKESDRLKKNKAQNLPPTAGDTPTTTPKSQGILGDIF